MNFILIAVIVLCLIALVSALILYLCSKKFAVHEDPRISEVAALLPQANCGGCGFPGCSGMADALVKAADKGSIKGLTCPVGGFKVMTHIANALNLSYAQTEPKIAVVRCNGACNYRPKTNEYSGMLTCSAINICGTGETNCGYGCLGCGDCVSACQFDAIHINEKTKLPEVDENKCTSCGACVTACPRDIIELRKKGPKGRRVFVSCVNSEKGPHALKSCKVACIGCGKCQEVCPFGAISIKENLSYIDYEICRLCCKCERVCPTNAILTVNFPVAKDKKMESQVKQIVAQKL
jgi:Na+-translocating ferredoxin:NAD+ oxidoreductase subunit B